MLIEYIRLIARRWWLVAMPVLAVIVVTALTYQPPGIAYQITLRFAAGLVPERTPDVYNYDRQYAWLASEYTANGLADIVRTTLFAENVSARTATTGAPIAVELLQAALAADQKQSIVVVYLTWSDAADCARIGEAIIAELVQNGASYWSQLSASGSAPVVALDKPTPVPVSVSLRDRFDLPVRLLLALVFGIALALLAHILDPMVRQPAELERMGIPIAGSIPRDEGSPHLSS